MISGGGCHGESMGRGDEAMATVFLLSKIWKILKKGLWNILSLFYHMHWLVGWLVGWLLACLLACFLACLLTCLLACLLGWLDCWLDG